MNTPLPDGPVGEAWILSDRAEHASQVSEGPLRGMTLTELMAEAGTELLGELAGRFERFPLLLKFLDVREMLSVQVHPRDDQNDLLPEGETGKTEAWVVLAADPGCRLYAGLKSGATAENLRALTTETADDRLASFKPEIGQGVLIEAGTVHALGDGVMVFEVQENSDVTFRLYDWDHVDARTGEPRDLQIDQALACVDFDQGAIEPEVPSVETTAPVRREAYFDDPHFRLWRLTGSAPFEVGAEGAPRILVCIEGAGCVESGGADHPLARGGVILLPAALGVFRFRPEGSVTLLEIAVAEPA
jgi:mannose-6-phosphate isomerase